jgi:hypothetical protein
MTHREILLQRARAHQRHATYREFMACCEEFKNDDPIMAEILELSQGCRSWNQLFMKVKVMR